MNSSCCEVSQKPFLPERASRKVEMISRSVELTLELLELVLGPVELVLELLRLVSALLMERRQFVSSLEEQQSAFLVPERESSSMSWCPC